MGVEEWTSVLKLSTKWNFSEERGLAIRELSQGDNVELVTNVLLARQYNAPELLLAAYEGLVKRTESISEEEAERLGLATVIRLYWIREENVRERFGSDRARCDSEVEIRRDFAEELKEAETEDISMNGLSGN